MVLAVMSLAPHPAGAAHGGDSHGGDPHAYASSRQFIANAGQWDARVRFVVIGADHSAWFCADEIVILQRREHAELPGETPSLDDGVQEMEVRRLRFASGANNRTVEALDTLPGKAHFYLGSDSARWREYVPTHGGIRYRNVAPGVDMEIRFPNGQAPLGSNDTGTGNAGIQVELTGSGTGIEAHVVSGGTQHRLWLDGEALQCFMAAIGGGEGEHFYDAKGDAESITMYGMTTNAEFPVLNPIQASYKGSSDLLMVGYDVKNRQVRYSTYLGSPKSDQMDYGLEQQWLCLSQRKRACRAVCTDTEWYAIRIYVHWRPRAHQTDRNRDKSGPYLSIWCVCK